MAYLSDITFRRALELFVLALAFLTTGSWLTVKLTTDHLLDRFAVAEAQSWARYLGESVSDLERIASGEEPSAASIAFFKHGQAGHVFRYTIFNREGYSQLISDHDKIALVDISEFNAGAARAIAKGEPVVDVKTGNPPNLPLHFAEAFVPARVNGKAVAVVAAYVDETAAREQLFSAFVIAAVVFCLLTALAFTVPAIAWYRRTREKQQADRRIRFLAHHDALTGLVNRARLIERLDSALAVLPTVGGQIAVHFIDLDRFKDINDTFGHDGGDFLLGAMGRRLTAITRIDDLVARLGGDEFVVVQTAVSDKAQVEAFAQRIASVLARAGAFPRAA